MDPDSIHHGSVPSRGLTGSPRAYQQTVFTAEQLRGFGRMVPHPARQAILNLTEAALEERFGLQFQAGPRDDGLGPTRVAGLVLESGYRVLLVVHGIERMGCEVVADYEDVAEPEPVTELLTALGLGPEVVAWRPPPDWPERPRRGA